jgi:hypothetical protein
MMANFSLCLLCAKYWKTKETCLTLEFRFVGLLFWRKIINHEAYCYSKEEERWEAERLGVKE